MGAANRDSVIRLLDYLADNPDTILSAWERLYVGRMRQAITWGRRISLANMWIAKDIYESITR